MHRLLASVCKETKIILRDREALFLLFAMPLAFVLIMSLAMRDAFKEKGEGIIFPVIIVDMDKNKVGRSVISAFSVIRHFKVDSAASSGRTDEAAIKNDIAYGNHRFAIIIPPETTRQAVRRAQEQMGFAEGNQTEAVPIRLLSDPTMQGIHRSLVISSLNRILQGIEAKVLMEQLAGLAEGSTGLGLGMEEGEIPKDIRVFSEVAEEPVSRDSGSQAMPTSVQQNMPGWSLFAMFFLVIPLSVTFIKEKQQGSFQRLKSMPVSPWLLIGGKIIPYFIINQLQFVSMMLVGIYLMPLMGGDLLNIGNSPASIAILTVSASFAAIGYGLMVATFCRTSEQATTFGGTSVIIFGALGGIMVPKFVMPPFLQKLTAISPMSWGLEGFFDIFVRNGNVRDILPESFMLLTFASVCLSVAAWRFKTT